MPDPPRRRPSTSARPIARAHFRVFIGEVELGVLAVSPLHWTDHDEADPGLANRVVLRRGATTDRTFFDWWRRVAAGRSDVRTVTIAALDGPGGEPVAIWRLEGATAVRWSGPSLDAMSDEVACEELEVRYEAIAWRDRV